MSRLICLLVVVAALFNRAQTDVSHFFAPDISYFQHHHHIPQQQQQSAQIPIAFQPPPQLYGPPHAPVAAAGSYPNPPRPIHVVTPAPVAPVFSSTTEFTLPEVVDNRNAKDERQFIPLNKQYLPPTEERPNYESPQPGDPDYPYPGYFYNKPTTSTTTTTTTTTSTTKRPIVVEDTLPAILPPVNNDEIGYDYNIPSPVIQEDNPFHSPSTPAPLYLPAEQFDAPPPPQTVIVNGDSSAPPLRLRVHEMRCLHQSNQGGYFRSVLKVDSFIGATPTVDNDSSDKRCELKLHKSYVVVDVAGEDFSKCGVQQCGEDLCLRLRFPAIRGMRTGADSILTLHCKSQSRVAVKMHALKMGVASDVQARSVGTYAKGGTQNSFRTHVELLRNTPQGYARHLKSNEAVPLGEDLLLRAHVLTGDGWNYTKLTDVSLQRISPSGEVLNNVNLITPQGCLNPSMKGVCTQVPSFDAPLGYKLPFKAVMFQGMKSGDELIMSMRITGCLDYNECQVHEEQCLVGVGGNLLRRKRDLSLTQISPDDKSTQNHTEASEISKISFKVVMPEERQKLFGLDTVASGDKAPAQSLILMGSLGFVVLLVCLGIFVVLKLRK